MSINGSERFGRTVVLLTLGALVASACTSSSSLPMHNDDPLVISPKRVSAVRAADLADTVPDDHASTTTTTAPIAIKWVSVDPSPIEMGDVIHVRGQLAEPLPDARPWLNIYLLRKPSYRLMGLLCGTRAAADGSFGCARGSGAATPFGPYGAGVYVIAVGDPWDVVMEATFEIVGNSRG